MKNILVYTLIASMAFPLALKAEEMSLPVINRPAALEEGIQTQLSAAQIQELLPWAKDSKLFLTDLLETINGLSTSDKIESLVNGIKQVVGESAPKNSELLMRYALNRSLVVYELIAKEMDGEAVGTADAKVRILIMSINMALRYYDIDMSTLTKKTSAPFMTFGVDYFTFLTNLNKSIFDASAQYYIQRTALEWLQWDLYRDLKNASYAPQIVKINNSLKMFPVKQMKDSQYISLIRQMKKVTLGMEFEGKKIALESISANSSEIIFNKNTTPEKAGSFLGNLFGNASEDPERNNTDSNVSIGTGDRINKGSYYGTVQEAFGNGTLKVTLDGYSGVSTYNASEVGKGIRCFDKVCVKDRVNINSYVGTVEEVFTNKRAKVVVDGYSGYSVYSTSDLGVGASARACKLKVCPGNRIEKGSYVGTVKEAFNNNTVKVSLDGYGSYSFYSMSEVGIGVDSLDGFQVGTRVIKGSYTGTIVELFNNKRAKVKVDGYSGYSMYNLSDLSM